MTTHFSSGVTNVSGNDPLGALRTMSPNLYYSQNFDFFTYAATDWVVTESDSGSTEALLSGSGGQGGVLLITNASAGATDLAQLQYAGGAGFVVLSVQWDPTKDMIVTARAKASDATNTAWLIGLASTDTSLIASLPTNGIYFYKAAAATTLIASARRGGVSTSVTLGATASDTFDVMSMVYTAVDGTWRAGLNGTVVGSFLGTGTISPTVQLSASIALTNATAAAHVMSIDYLNIMVQR